MSTPPLTHAPGTDAHEQALRPWLVPWVALAWSAVALALGLGWLAGVLPRGVPDEAGFGSLFLGTGVGVGAVVAMVFGVVGAVCALGMLRPGAAAGRPGEVGAWVLAGGALVVFVDGQLLAWLGYGMVLPVVGWFVPGLALDWVEATLEPVHLTSLFFVLGVAVWVAAALTHRRAVRALPGVDSPGGA